jgi:predicted phosphoadenosine phosphosulfate sulfurtransferase
MNVLEATLKRFELLFTDFENICFSVSGGKDSSTMVQLANIVSSKMNKKFDVMFLDQEAISKFTVEHINELKKLPQIRRFYHICLPLEEDNGCSFFEPQWIMWDKNKKDIWVRDIPDSIDVIHEDNHMFSWFKKGMSDLEFYPLFSDWYQKQYNNKIANIVGIRSRESYNRRISINNRYRDTYKSLRWSLIQSKNVTGNENIYRFFPMFDWSVNDIWKCVFKFDFKFNKIYEQMYKNGISIYDMRICQPFGVEQRIGLKLFARTEPETWEKIINRVSGANCGSLYSNTKLFGHLKTNKPKNMTWEQYCCFLIESISLKNIEIAKWYIDKIEVTLKFHKKKYKQEITDKTINNSKEYISWQCIARALEKNDFWMKRLNFSESKKGYELLKKLGEQNVEI